MRKLTIERIIDQAQEYPFELRLAHRLHLAGWTPDRVQGYCENRLPAGKVRLIIGHLEQIRNENGNGKAKRNGKHKAKFSSQPPMLTVLASRL